jgi:hypothetical protein
MASEDIILLDGAPDALIVSAEAKGSTPQVMQLEMTNDILDELLDCVRRKQPPQVLFGRNPVSRGAELGFPLSCLPLVLRHRS